MPKPGFDFVIYAADKFGRLGLGLCASLFIARILSPGLFGTLSYYISIFAIVGSISSLGLDSILDREFPRERLSPGRLFYTVLVGRSLVCTILSAGICTYFALKVDMVGLQFAAILTPIALFNVSDAGDALLRGRGHPSRIFRCRISAAVIGNICRCAVAYETKSALLVGLCAAIEPAIGAILITKSIVAAKISDYADFVFDIRLFVRVGREALPMLGVVVLNSVHARIDLIVVEKIWGSVGVGIFSVAVLIISAVCMLPAALLNAVSRKLSAVRAADAARFSNLMAKCFRGSIALGLVLVVAVFLLSRTAVFLVLGPKYTSAAEIALAYSLYVLPVSFGTFWSFWLVLEDKSKMGLFAHLVTISIHFGLLATFAETIRFESFPLLKVTAAFCGQVVGICLFKPAFILKSVLFLK